MMRIKTLQSEGGFTLIEVLVAMVVLTIGILAIYSMQIVSIKGNANAIRLTTASTWAAGRVEQIFALDYDDADLQDDGDITNATQTSDGVGGLGNATDATADGKMVSSDGNYTIYWNVADSLTPIPGSNESSVKAIRVIVQRNFGIPKQVALNYYKQKTF